MTMILLSCKRNANVVIMVLKRLTINNEIYNWNPQKKTSFRELIKAKLIKMDIPSDLIRLILKEFMKLNTNTLHTNMVKITVK